MIERDRRRRGTGTLLNLGAAVAYSAAGLFTRVIDLDVWTLLFWRGLFSALFLGGLLWALHRGRTWTVLRQLGWPGFAVALASTSGMVFYVHALRQTTVADVAVIYAASPFVTATLVWIWFRERQAASTTLASLAALVGVAIMVSGDAGGGHLLGDALAFGMTVCMALMMIVIHRYPEVPMLGAACLSCIFTSVSVGPLASWNVTASDLGWLVLFGSQLGVGQALLTIGTRLVSATQSAIIGTLDAPLAPLWVWFAVDEVPSWRTVVGGTIVLTSVVAQILVGDGTVPVPHVDGVSAGRS